MALSWRLWIDAGYGVDCFLAKEMEYVHRDYVLKVTVDHSGHLQHDLGCWLNLSVNELVCPGEKLTGVVRVSRQERKSSRKENSGRHSVTTLLHQRPVEV